MAKNRIPLQVSPQFTARLKELQKRIRMAQGENRSLRELTEDIVASPFFLDIEKNLIKAENVQVDFKIKFDRRLFS